VSALSVPAQQSLIAALVEEEDVPQAVALNSMTFNLARAIGPASAAGVIAALGIPWAFAVNAASYLLLVLGVLLVTPHPREFAARGQAQLRESLRLVLEQPQLLAFLLIVTAVGFASDPVNTEAPAFADAFHIHHGVRLWTGVIVGAFGAGAITAAFLLAGRVAGSRRRMMTTLSVLCVGIVGFSVSPSLWVGLAFLAVGGFGYLASNTSATSRLQLDVAPHQRGRIMALWSVAFLGLRPIASLTDGAIAGAFGVRAAGVALAVPAALGAAAIYFLQRRHTPLTSRA
jgi:MFS family permease